MRSRQACKPASRVLASARVQSVNVSRPGVVQKEGSPAAAPAKDSAPEASGSHSVLLTATKQQVMDAELLFVERIDVAAEAVRSPDEIGRMLREAEGQIGALTEVIGGTCVVSNLCPAKFACIGCAGNAPDPERRYQIETKRSWALEQITWAHREQLSAEERQMRRVVQDCELLLEEMSLIERAREDQAQQISIHQEEPHDRKK
jgi:hypothetical protein